AKRQGRDEPTPPRPKKKTGFCFFSPAQKANQSHNHQNERRKGRAREQGQGKRKGKNTEREKGPHHSSLRAQGILTGLEASIDITEGYRERGRAKTARLTRKKSIIVGFSAGVSGK